jgi:N-acetyl-1-D-myo-inositol-2-amino-2-deoxy-alpha-D-glucopyranoside deacetylase/mycothiol S-conjugate amidase
MAGQRLLYTLAHPDDESFGQGGVVARYVAEGAEVSLIVSTNGEAGTVSQEMLNGYDSIAALRLAELDCAAEVLGFKEVIRLGYKDSGMMGSESSKDPACSWQAPREELARKVVEVIRRIRPQVVVTFNKYGGYGHPDHIAIQRATTDAFTLAGDPSYETPGLSPYQPQKLYYSSGTRRRLRWRIWRIRLQGKDPRRMGRNHDIDMVAILDNVEPRNTLIDVRDYFEVWDRARNCHASQLGEGPKPVRPASWYRRNFESKVGFHRIVPDPGHSHVDEHDLFAGVRLDEAAAVP